MRDRIAKLVSIGALLVVVFCLGMVWPKTQLWPTSWFKQANVAASAFYERYLSPDLTLIAAPDDRAGVIVRRWAD